MAKNNVQTDNIEHTELLDRKMGEVFDSIKDAKLAKMPVRVAIWNYYMGENSQNTMETVDAAKWELKADDDKIKDFVKKNILK